MKVVKKPVVVLKKKKKASLHDGSFTEAAAQFNALEPMAIATFTDSVMRTKTKMRPYLSAASKKNGYDYFTLGIGNDEMLVVRYTLKTPKKGK